MPEGQSFMLKPKKMPDVFFSNDRTRETSRQVHDPLPLDPAPVGNRTNRAKQRGSLAPLERGGQRKSILLVPLRRQAVAHRNRGMKDNHYQPR